MTGVDDFRNVLLFAFYYLPDNTSGVQRAVRMAKYLPENGFCAHVISSSHRGEQAGIPHTVHVPNQSTRPAVPRVCARLVDAAQRVLPYNEQLPWAPHAIAAARGVMAEKPVSAVISTSPPVGPHLAAMYMKRRCGLKWIADFRDPLFGNPGRARGWARPYDIVLERAIFKSADAVIAVTDAVESEWRKRYPQWAHKFHVIWNGFDPEDGFGPQPIPPRSHRVLAHIGVLYTLRYPTRLLASMGRLFDRGLADPESIRIKLLGIVQDEPLFRSNPVAADLIDKGVLELRNELIPRRDAMFEIATSDYLLLIDIDNLSNVAYTVPAKIYDYILTGRPVLAITRRDSPVDRILSRSGPRQVCLYQDDPDGEIDRKLHAFLQLDTEPVAPSSWFLRNFDGRQQASALAGLLRNVLEAPAPGRGCAVTTG